MGFKLVRVDATEPCKIPLAVGTHFIGRGKFLDCHDHRVSRNHGQLEVTDDTVRIIALHQNPCFFRRKGIQNTLILPQNESIELSNGDQFGLVPESYWYELIYCIESLVPPCGDQTSTSVQMEKSTNDEPSVIGPCGNVTQIDIENTEQIQPSVSQDTNSTLMDTALEMDMPTTSPYKRAHSNDSPNTVNKKVKTGPQSPCASSENQDFSNNNIESPAINSKTQAAACETQAVNSENQAAISEAQATTSETQAATSETHAATSETQAATSETQAVNINKTLQGNIMLGYVYAESEKETETTLATVKTEPCSPDTIKTELFSQDDVTIEPCSIDTVKKQPCSQDNKLTAPSSSNNVKTEAKNETVNTEPNNNVKIEPNSEENVHPGPSNNQLGDASAASAAAKVTAGAAAPAQPVPPIGAEAPAQPAGAGASAQPAGAAAPAQPARPREKCMYGAQCYRVNPAHKAQFSHPGDADWAVRVPCRWGAACRDIRPAHWRDHDHPPRQQPHERRRGGHGIRVVQRHGNIFYINANSVHFYDDHFQVQDSDGESVDYDYEF